MFVVSNMVSRRRQKAAHVLVSLVKPIAAEFRVLRLE